jgi:uncharacterized protein (DUF1778 family)
MYLFLIAMTGIERNLGTLSLSPQNISLKDKNSKSPTNKEVLKKADNSIQVVKYHTNVSGKLMEIEMRLNRIENKLESLIEVRQSAINNQIPQPNSFSLRIDGANPEFEAALNDGSDNLMLPLWIEKLPSDVQEVVNQIFKEHARMVIEKLSLLTDEDKEDVQIIENIMEESDKILREELSRVLSDEEFQSFLDSLPEPTPDAFSDDIKPGGPEFDVTLNGDSDSMMLPSWIGKLPPDVQENVNQIFMEHTEMVSEKLAFLSDEDKEDNQTIENIIGEYDKILMEKLSRVLSDEEFQSFLDSLPQPTPGFEKP